MKKILVIDGHSYYAPFSDFGPYEDDVNTLRQSPREIGLVVFTGGEDVTPSFYKEKHHYTTANNLARDEYERGIFLLAKQHNIPMAGICRGSQFLCVMAGGCLVQNIHGHGGNHPLRTNDNRLITVSSTHHQMQLPPKSAEIVAWAEPKRSDVYEGWTPREGVWTPEKEFDCVYYPNIKALGMQYHPEYMPENSEGFQYCIELVEKYIFE